LWSLGEERKTYYSVGYYLEYLTACRRIAGDAGTDLRTLEKPSSAGQQNQGFSRYAESPGGGETGLGAVWAGRNRTVSVQPHAD
jgi:hypothetical protein